MIWKRRKRDTARPAAVSPTSPQMSEETRRARAAARAAAIQLDQVRAQRANIERTAQEIEDLNAHNGFYGLIRNALGA